MTFRICTCTTNTRNLQHNPTHESFSPLFDTFLTLLRWQRDIHSGGRRNPYSGSGGSVGTNIRVVHIIHRKAITSIMILLVIVCHWFEGGDCLGSSNGPSFLFDIVIHTHGMEWTYPIVAYQIAAARPEGLIVMITGIHSTRTGKSTLSAFLAQDIHKAGTCI